MARIRVGVVFGGMSEEHPISIKSAQQVADSLDLAKYEPVYIGITTDGRWRRCEAPGPDWETGSVRAVLAADRSVGGLLVGDDGEPETVPLDVIIPVLHGRFGEDGAIQGLFELSGIPYVGCDVQSSAMAMDKALTYLAVRSIGIATPEFRVVQPGETVDAAQLTYPVFVKPARSGSSYGVTRVDGPEQLDAAIEDAAQYDPKVLIEGAVVGAEVGSSVLETADGLIVGEHDQIALSHGFFRIHQEAKPEQGSENATFLVPAEIPAEVSARLTEAAKRIFQVLGCRGIARVDCFVTAEGEVILNEVNTFPGMTSYSRYPRMMAAAGLALPEVLDRLIDFARTGRRR